jgi:rhodanese-related sulfurtransferase
LTDGGIPDIDADTARRWLDAGDTVMIDVREPVEVAREAVPLARPAPLSSFDPAALALGDARRVIMLCAVGIRSVKAGVRLAALGDGREIVNLKGGLAAWKQAGLPVRGGNAAPATPVPPQPGPMRRILARLGFSRD